MWTYQLLFLFFLSLSLDAFGEEKLIRPNVELANGKSIVLDQIHGSKIQIDGHLNEMVWKELPFYDEFVVIEPDSLKKPIYSTRVKIFYDSLGIYFGIDIYFLNISIATNRKMIDLPNGQILEPYSLPLL